MIHFIEYPYVMSVPDSGDNNIARGSYATVMVVTLSDVGMF